MTSSPVGASTRVADATWTSMPSGLRPCERTVLIGDSDEQWRLASQAVLRWGVKTRSGFTVHPLAGSGLRVVDGADYTVVAAVGPMRIREPVRVVGVVDVPDRRGFAYATRPGHPVTGEEAFVVHRTADGRVWFILRSLTGPGLGPWRVAFPLILLAQRWYRRRYILAVRSIAGPHR